MKRQGRLKRAWVLAAALAAPPAAKAVEAAGGATDPGPAPSAVWSGAPLSEILKTGGVEVGPERAAQAPGIEEAAPAATRTYYLRDNWDDAVTWDRFYPDGSESQRAYSNPGSNPMAEILIGDAGESGDLNYRMPNITAFFRFTLDLPEGARIKAARLNFSCSFGPPPKHAESADPEEENRAHAARPPHYHPRFLIRYIDAPGPVDLRALEPTDHREDPVRYPLSAARAEWTHAGEPFRWHWQSHRRYATDDISALVQDYVDKHGAGGTIVLVIANPEDNRNRIWGIKSFDDEPQNAASLDVTFER